MPILCMSSRANGVVTKVVGTGGSTYAQVRDPREIQDDLHRLGRALLRRADEVIEQIASRASDRIEAGGGAPLDAALDERFVQLGTLATIAVGRWLAGEPMSIASAASTEFSKVFAQLIASSDLPLGEVVRRCRYWRDGCDLVLRECSEMGMVGTEALTSARESIHRAADHALAQMSAIFDAERHRIEAELTRRQEQLSFLATHDALTSLANRTLIMDRLEMMLAQVEREGGTVEILFVDLDDFKMVNDTFGHRVGDELLVAVAERLSAIVREADTLGRMGGDEFVVLAYDRSGECATEVAARLLQAMTAPFVLSDGHSVRISASVGIATSRQGVSAQHLLYDADMAMYGAKADGRGVICSDPSRHVASIAAAELSRR